MKVINVEGHILGRVASLIAQELLKGTEIKVVNASKSIITGKKSMIIDKYRKKRELVHRRKGPFYPKRADRIFKRTVKGMLPIKKQKGKNAFSKLQVYMGIPDELKDVNKIQIKQAMELTSPKYITLGEVSLHLGAKGSGE